MEDREVIVLEDIAVSLHALVKLELMKCMRDGDDLMFSDFYKSHHLAEEYAELVLDRSRDALARQHEVN